MTPAEMQAEIDRLRAELAKTKPIADAAAAYYTAFIDQRDYGDMAHQTWQKLFAAGPRRVSLTGIQGGRMTRHEVLEEFGYYAAQSALQGYSVMVKMADEIVRLRTGTPRVLNALQDPDSQTVEAALEAEWAHGRAEPDATRRTSARAALIGVARHLRERLGL